jgi:predicted glycosyltransferase
MSRPGLLLYCQHSLGLGHAVRSFALATALTERFRVVLACGGELVDGLTPHHDVELVELPPLRASTDGALMSREPERLGAVRRRRRRLLLETFRALRPAVVVVELFPFGRRRLADELVPLLEEARAATPRPVLVSSVRDILVGRGPDQQAHDTISCVLANRYLDAVVVHSDPRFARLEESFRPGIPLRVPVRHTGFVVPEAGERQPARPHEDRVLISAGGGLVGAPLLRAALDARPLLPRELRVEVVTGPFLPEEDWNELRRTAERLPGVELHRFAPDLGERLRSASASVSQCGYNTALDLLRARIPALVVPFAEGREDEQARRAARLERLGALRVLPPERLEPTALAREIRTLLDSTPRPIDLDFAGAQASTALLAGFVRDALPAEAAVAAR